MNRCFEVQLSAVPIDGHWGKSNFISFTEQGALIHVKALEDSAEKLALVQRSARQLAKMKIPHMSLVGEWSFEAQWHFWQGAFAPINMPAIDFAALTHEQENKLSNHIKIHNWVRSIINQTPQELSPIGLATQTAAFITELAPGCVTHEIISGEKLADENYVGIYEVGRGSEQPPALLTLDYRPANCNDNEPAVTLVGKGITFDSGGYSMKSSQGMLHMKSDMGGAATLAGALGLAIAQGIDKPVRLILCCAENLVSGNAYKLSDILTYRNGVSVEIVNTDAEGRLVLADGLIDASRSGSPIIIDAATLTGAAVVAVGNSYNALFSMDEELARQFGEIAESNFDKCWRLPLTDNHKHNCPSPYADTANSKPIAGGGAGGASNAAGFLSRFVEDPSKGWLHIDLAACYRGSEDASWSTGATGRGVRSIAAFLNQL